jgi:hypothetical protein
LKDEIIAFHIQSTYDISQPHQSLEDDHILNKRDYGKHTLSRRKILSDSNSGQMPIISVTSLTHLALGKSSPFALKQ